MKKMKNRKVKKGGSRKKGRASRFHYILIENWICPECHFVNNGYRKECGDCGAKKPTLEILEQYKTQRE